MYRMTLILQNILALIPFVLLCVALMKVNLKKIDRGRQFMMPIVALVYFLVLMIGLEYVNYIISGVIDAIIEIAPSEEIKSMLSRLHLESAMFYIYNYVFLIVYLIVKRVCLVLFGGIWARNHTLMEATSGHFYTYNADMNLWTLQNRWSDLRTFFFWLFWAAVAIATVLTLIMRINAGSLAFSNAFYPVFSVVILGEIAFFLSGATKTEYIEDILGENEKSYRIYNYSGLRKVLKAVFGDRVIYDRYVDHSENEWSTFGSLDEMMESTDRNIRNVGNYFYKLKMQGKEIDMHYVKTCMDLDAGKSVLVNNPFYRDLTDYLLFVMMRTLLSHRKILIVAGRDAIEGDLKKWLEDSFFSYMNISHFWKVDVLNEDSENWDIGIMQFSEIHNLALQKNQEKELAHVKLVLLIEPSKIMATGQLGLSLLLNRCGKKDPVVYCACDRNSDGVVDALSHLLKVSITEVSASSAMHGRTSELYWKADGPYMHHKILPSISRYLGVGSEIGAVAIRNQISNVSWLSSEKFPVFDMKWFLGQYYQTFCKYTNLPVGQENIYKHFDFQSNLWQCDSSKTKFLIVEDEFCNLFEAMRLFGTRAGQEGVINIISEEYLLREYMLDHVSTFQNDPKAIPSIVPEYARTEKNVLLRLLMLMAEEPVKESHILSELRLIGIETNDVYHTLQALFNKHCSAEILALKVLYKEELSEDRLRTISVKYFVLGHSAALTEYMSRLKNAYYVAEDEKGKKHYIASKLYGHVFQTLLPGQFFTYAGKYYEVLNITAQNGVIVRRAAEHITDRKYYRQKQSVYISNYTPDTRMGTEKSINNIKIMQGYAEILVQTHGYYQLKSNDDLETGKYVCVNGIPERKYYNKNILKLELPGVSGPVKATICIVLSEMFRTIYPNNWQYLHVLSGYWDETDDKLNALLAKLETGAEDDCIYFVEDSDIDMGLLVSIERNIKRYLEYVMEFLMWHGEKMLEEPPAPPEEVVRQEVVFDNKDRYTLIERIKLFFRSRKRKGVVPEVLPDKKLRNRKDPTEDVEEEIVEDVQEEETIVEDVPVEETIVEDAPVEETIVEDAPVEETIVEDAPVEETIVEDAPDSNEVDDEGDDDGKE